MPPRSANAASADKTATPTVPGLLLVWGDDEFGVKRRAKQVFELWCREIGGGDQEIIEAAAANSGEALRSLARLREALQTLPFFGIGKVIWFQNCNFLGEERTAESQTVVESLADLAAEFKVLPWGNLRLLISAGKVDRRKIIAKTIDKIGKTEAFQALSYEDRDWVSRAQTIVQSRLKQDGKSITSEALSALVNAAGPNVRLLDNEAEKLALYLGDRPKAGLDDVRAIGVRTRHAKAFALGEAVGDRDLPQLLRHLEDEMWEVKIKMDRQKSVIGLLQGVITKVRNLLLVKELMREGYLAPERDSDLMAAQLAKIPEGLLPSDRRFNPSSQHPYVIVRAAAQAGNFTSAELVQALDILLDCNRTLVSSDTEEKLALQQALIRIVAP